MFRVLVRRPEGCGEILRDRGRDLNRRDHAAEQVRELLLTDVGVVAAAVVVRAVVVDILAFFAFRRNRAATVRTRQEAHEGVALFQVPRPRLASSDGLHVVEQFTRDHGLVAARVFGAVPHEVARVDGVLQEAMDFRFEQAPIGARVGEADRLRLREEGLERVGTSRVELKQLGNQRRTL